MENLRGIQGRNSNLNQSIIVIYTYLDAVLQLDLTVV